MCKAHDRTHQNRRFLANINSYGRMEEQLKAYSTIEKKPGLGTIIYE
jgi:hypothetical protein